MDPTDVPETWIVRLELRRIQTFLFSGPRMRSMLGANALLGQAIRHDLPLIAQSDHSLACALDWVGQPPLFDEVDPLAKATIDWTAADAPAQALKHGVLSRDGGHLRVVFQDTRHADTFIAKAREYLGRNLPGLLYSLNRIKLPCGDEELAGAPADRLAEPVDLPQFQVCTRSGTEVASGTEMTPDGNEVYPSAATSAKEKAGEDFQKAGESNFKSAASRKPRDYISLLREHMPRRDGLKPPRDLDQLSDAGGYLAVIHADGNRVGQRIKAYEKSLGKLDGLAKECAIERFFCSMRSAVRAALIEALKAVFTDDELKEHQYLPFQLLMLGGDDLLLVCHPRYALPFVEHYADQLKDRELADTRPLSIGAGVIIAKHTLPFHRLHQLAESLAGSAKRAYLQNATGQKEPPPQERSVVDWSVLTASWGEDPLDQRRAHDCLDYGTGNDRVVLGLSAKPYFVLEAHAADGEQPLPSLQALLDTAQRLENVPELPRSQLKDMLRHLQFGYEGAMLAYRELLAKLPEAAQEQLVALIGPNTPWLDTGGDKGPVRAITQLKDLIECLELRYLGRRKQEPRHD